MADINFVKSKTYSTSLNDSASNTGKLYFPSDAPCIIMDGKEYGRSGGVSQVASLTSVPVNNTCIYCACSSAQTLTLGGSLMTGVTYKLLVYNTGSSSVSVTVNASSIGGGALMLIGSTFGSAGGILQSSLTLSVSITHGMLIKLTRMTAAITVIEAQ